MRRFVALSVAILAILLIVAPVGAASWSVPSPITSTHDAFPAYARSLAASGGVEHLVDSRSGGQIEYRRSTDGGAHWSVPVVLAQPDATFTSVLLDPAIAARGSEVVMAYRAHDATAAYVFIRRSCDGGLTWGAPQRIARVVTDRRMGEQSVAISAAGVFVAWTDRTNGHIDLRRSTDGGRHFAPTQKIGVTTNTFSPGDPTFTDGLIGLAANGDAVYLAWSPSGQGSADSIVLSRSLDGGSSFLPRTTIFSGADFGWPSLAAAGPYLVGQFTTADGKLRTFSSADRGHHVTTRQIAAPSTTTTVGEGSVALGADGSAVVSYERTGIGSGTSAPLGTLVVRRSSDGGATWSGAQAAASKVSGPGNILTSFTNHGTLLVYGTCTDAAFVTCDLAEVRGN